MTEQPRHDGLEGDHFTPDGLCQCKCADCTSCRGTCVCDDCSCESQDDHERWNMVVQQRQREYLHATQRNDPIRQRLGFYGSEGAAWDENGQKVSRWLCAEKTFVALRTVLDRHGPMQYGDEATNDDLEPTNLWCNECSGDSFHRERFPCATRRDIAEALGEE